MNGLSPSELAWAVLETSATVLGEVRVRESGVATPDGDVLHAIDTEGRRHLLVPVGADATVIEDRASAGVQIAERVLLENGTQRRFLDVVCLMPHLDVLFSAVADEMLRAVDERPHDAERACHSVLGRWREFLERPRAALLGPQRLAGLLAELRWLERLAAAGGERVLAMWVGPTGARFDFVAGERAIEVKATLGREGRAVEIHGDRQLEGPPSGDLHLAFVRFEPAGEAGDTVPATVERLAGLGIDRLRLMDVLARAGYDAREAQAYTLVPFRVVEELVYRVDASFPRIVPASFIEGHIPERVTSLRYWVNLEGGPPFPLPDDEVEHLVRSFVAAVRT